jgi:hypothetical protein
VVDLCDEVSEVRTERICNVQDLDEVEAPLATLVLRHERLRSTERVGQLELRKASGVPGSDQPLAQPD